MISPTHPAFLLLNGRSVNGYRVQVDSVSTQSDPEEVTGKLVDEAEKDPRPSVPFEVDTYPQLISDPAHLQRILEQLGSDSGTGAAIKFRYVP